MGKLCTKLTLYADLETDKEANSLIDWILLSNIQKENNNMIRALTAEYKYLDREQRKGVKEALKRNSEICKERDLLYEKQQDIKHELYMVEKRIR